MKGVLNSALKRKLVQSYFCKPSNDLPPEGRTENSLTDFVGLHLLPVFAIEQVCN